MKFLLNKEILRSGLKLPLQRPVIQQPDTEYNLLNRVGKILEGDSGWRKRQLILIATPQNNPKQKICYVDIWHVLLTFLFLVYNLKR